MLCFSVCKYYTDIVKTPVLKADDMRRARFPCHAFSPPEAQRAQISNTAICLYCYTLCTYFFLARERYWFRQLYYRLDPSPQSRKDI